MRNDIIRLLGSQGLWADSWKITDKEVQVNVRSPRISARCPRCQKRSKRVHQYYHRIMKHSVWQSRTVILCLRKRRFFCSSCGKSFSESIPGMNRKRNTKNL